VFNIAIAVTKGHSKLGNGKAIHIMKDWSARCDKLEGLNFNSELRMKEKVLKVQAKVVTQSVWGSQEKLLLWQHW
jgi:hypothetical protein